MNKQTLYSLWFLAPIVLWAQAENAVPVEIDLSDVVVIDEATESLPFDTEIVFELPGQEAEEPGEAIFASEETISVDFPDEDIRTILRNVADLFELNLVIPDTLQGRTSIKLRNVSWRQVFDEVLRQVGYTYLEDRNIIRITSLEELTTEPVDTRVFVANYARAQELQSSLAPLVDGAIGGRIQVDTRINALVITERPSRMNKIQEIIERLDKATDQVMIESKFVEVRRTDGKDLGVDWSSLGGVTGGVGVGISEAISAVTDGGTSFSTEEAQNALGFSATATKSGNIVTRNALDTAVFSSTSFGLVLKALEDSNNTELISNPTVVTMDNEKAIIKISREFPQPEFTFNAETGQRQFNGLGAPIDVGITLEVTPSVNAAGFINMDIVPEVSSTTEDRIIENTAFPIRDVRTARTRITIKDGYTLALGGLVSSEKSSGKNSVPLLGSLPGIGRMFSSEAESATETNLIIFITAKTLNPDGTDYKDTVDPRLLDRMQIVPSEVPGYDISSERRQRLQEISDARHQQKLEAEKQAELQHLKKHQQN
jgi:type IV pilus assembly protein PilQ